VREVVGLGPDGQRDDRLVVRLTPDLEDADLIEEAGVRLGADVAEPAAPEPPANGVGAGEEEPPAEQMGLFG